MVPRLLLSGLLLVGLSLPSPGVVAVPLPVNAITPEAGDALVARRLGAPRADEALQQLGQTIVAYADQPEGLKLRFRVVEAKTPWTLVLPNGGVYLSRPVLDALRGDVQRTSFLLASLAGLAIDGTARDDETVADLASRAKLPDGLLDALEKTLTPERVATADRLAMLCLVRAGMPPLQGVRAIEDLGKLRDAGSLSVTRASGAPALRDRRANATKAATELIKAATEFDFGVMDLVQQHYSDAIGRFKTFLQVLPRNYAGWNNLGLCYYHLAIEPMGTPRFLFADAIAEFDTSFLTRSKSGPRFEELELARQAYEQATDIDPLRVDALTNLGNLHAVQHDYPKARHYYDLALSQRPTFAPALNNYGVVLAFEVPGDFPPEALTKFAAATESDPTLAEAQYNLGQARAELGQPDAEVAFRRYVALAPTGAKVTEVMRKLQGTGTPTPTTPTGPVMVAGKPEHELELYNRVWLALAAPRRDVTAMVAALPDQQRQVRADVSVLGWSSQGLVVELVSEKVNRVVAGRPPGHEAKTVQGVQVGFTTGDVKTKYGDPPAVSKQSPYDIWMYPRRGVGFFVLGQTVSKIFLFQTADPG